MRHQKKGFKLGRTQAHRKATLAALSNALIEHKRITTTFTKARALRIYVEPLINRAKDDTMNNRRQVFRYLQDKTSVTELFGEIGSRISDRPGGYTRIVKLGQRAGDSAEMAVIELVDYNDVKPYGSSDGTRRRTRRGGRKRTEVPSTVAAEDGVEEITEEVVAEEEVVEEAPEVAAEKTPEVQTEEDAPEVTAEESADKASEEKEIDAADKAHEESTDKNEDSSKEKKED